MEYSTKDIYIDWFMEECNTPADELSFLIDQLPEKERKEFLSQFEKDMETQLKSID